MAYQFESLIDYCFEFLDIVATDKENERTLEINGVGQRWAGFKL